MTTPGSEALGPAVRVATSNRSAVSLVVEGIVELAPFTRKQSIRLGDLRVKRFRRGMLRLLGAGVWLDKQPQNRRFMQHVTRPFPHFAATIGLNHSQSTRCLNSHPLAHNL